MTKLNRLFIDRIAPFIAWNPDEEGLTPAVEIDTKAFYKEMLNVMKGDYNSLLKDIVRISGDKDAVVLSKISMGDLLLLGAGIINSGTVRDMVADGVKETGYYKYSSDNAEEWIENCRTVAKEIHEARASGILDFDLSEVSFDLPGTGELVALNKLLSTTKLPPLQELVRLARDTGNSIKDAQEQARIAKDEAAAFLKDIETLKSEIGSMAAQAMTQTAEVKVESDGTIPKGELIWKDASEVFDVKLDVDFKVPYWEWDGVHPLVPAIDPHYIFRTEELETALYAIISNSRAYFHGHTGTGKTTLVEQVAARLFYPFVRINFDSEISRMDLIGRDTLKYRENEDGSFSSYSEFVDGMLPRAMSSPCLCMLDEIDFVRPDVAYVMQAATEGNGLRITEDGDRFVEPHPMFRMFASGNTVGQGDEDGLYQGARPQSSALLDRFTLWRRVDYLSKEQRDQLIKRHVPALAHDDLKKLSLYIDDHIEAFIQTNVMQPISPRGMLSVAKATVVFGDLKKALTMSVIDRASKDDRATLVGILDRCVS